MNIVIIGSGYVGTTAAAIFSVSGHNVTAIDIDIMKVHSLNNGVAPFYEKGLNELISEGTQKGALRATTTYESIKDADVVFSCVGTPDNPDGSSNLSYVFDTAKEAAKHLKEGAIFVQKSTVPVGTGRKVMELLPDYTPYVSNPEFLRESTAVYDTVMFDRVVTGGDNEAANQTILDIHRSVEANSEDIARIAGVQYKEGHTGVYTSTQLESAELIKVTANAFLALKISFANSIAKLSDVTGADIQEVMSSVGEDWRIGKAFFNAGRGYGGGCFPKDVAGLISSAENFGVDISIMKAAAEVNEGMSDYVIEKVSKAIPVSGENITVLGLSFKSGTSDTRKSPSIKIANSLSESGANVRVFDPQANEEARPELNGSIHIAGSLEDALQGAKVVIVATDWSEFQDLHEWVDFAPEMTVLVDAVNCLDKSAVRELDVEYISVGRQL